MRLMKRFSEPKHSKNEPAKETLDQYLARGGAIVELEPVTPKGKPLPRLYWQPDSFVPDTTNYWSGVTLQSGSSRTAPKPTIDKGKKRKS